jgi:hypothetical protein
MGLEVGTGISPGIAEQLEARKKVIGKIKDRIFWNIQAGELARRFNETQMAENDSAKGIVINEGTTAFIKANGELVAELHGGAYDFLEPEKLKKVFKQVQIIKLP